MPGLVYIHGFLSSPLSHKAVQLEQWVAEERPDIEYHCPALSAYPSEVRLELERLVESLLPGPVYLVGSSMGGFWATWLAEKYNLPAVLINPAVRPTGLMPKYVGIELKNYHNDDTYTLGQGDIDALAEMELAKPRRLENYWLLAQSGDETLDYRQALEYYQDSKQLVEEGGDHSFQGFERFIPASLTFCDAFYKKTI